MRSAPPFDDCKPPPSSTIDAHWAAASSAPAAAGVSVLAGLAVESDSRARPHSAASASCSCGSFVAICYCRQSIIRGPSLNDNLLEQDGRDPVGCDGGVDSACQFFLETIEAGRTVKIGRTQLAQIGLKCIHHARHQGLDLRDQHRIGQFEDDLHLEILSAIRTGV